MYRHQILTSLVLSAGVAASIASGACNRNDEPKAVAESQTQRAERANMPVNAVGCLKAGDAEGTFVLTAARTEGSADTATYQLVGDQAATLKDHVGHRVQITGTVEAAQELATRTTAVAKPAEHPTGTAGTPKVETRTEIDLKRVSVATVKPLAEKCDL